MAEHISPGFLTVGAANQIKRSIAETERLQQKAGEAMQYADVKDFPALITSGSGGYHAWTEQAFGPDNLRYTKPNGRTGTTTSNPAVLPDRSTLSSFPVECWLRRTMWSADKGVVYETVGLTAAGSSGGWQYITTVDTPLSVNTAGTQGGTLYTFSGLDDGVYYLHGAMHCEATVNAQYHIIVTGGNPSNYYIRRTLAVGSINDCITIASLVTVTGGTGGFSLFYVVDSISAVLGDINLSSESELTLWKT
jgi:hypothetical protein